MSWNGCAVARYKRVEELSVEFHDDVTLVWVGGKARVLIEAVFAYSAADVRLVLRQGSSDTVLASRLGMLAHWEMVHPLHDGDEIILQWRARTTQLKAISEAAELAVRTIQ